MGGILSHSGSGQAEWGLSSGDLATKGLEALEAVN